MSLEPKTPSRIWYVGHAFFWIITGLICYILYKDTNKPAAKKHLTHSLWISPVLTTAVFLLGTLVLILTGTTP